MSKFLIIDTTIEGLKVIERQPIGDHRGFLARLYCSEELKSVGWQKPIAQINQTVTTKMGTVRGLHFQYPPYAEMKLISCLKGEIWDVAVDLRKSSPTFMQWYAEKLSAENHRALLIPEGFAHGFQTLCDDCELLYFHSAPYFRESEAGIRANDPKLKISWPLNFYEISHRDKMHSLLDDQFEGLNL